LPVNEKAGNTRAYRDESSGQEVFIVGLRLQDQTMMASEHLGLSIFPFLNLPSVSYQMPQRSFQSLPCTSINGSDFGIFVRTLGWHNVLMALL
jgi:hypothetical protein